MSSPQLERDDELVRRCLESLRVVFRSVSVEFVPGVAPDSAWGAGLPPFDGELRLGIPREHGEPRFLVAIKRTHLSYALVDGLIGALREVKVPWLLFAPYIAPPMGRYLAERHVCYVDAVGNLHIAASGGAPLVHVAGIRSSRPASGQGARTPAHRVTFALLARPALLKSPVRAIAEVAGVGKTAVADHLKRLEAQGFLVRTSQGPSLLRTGELLDRWLAAYVDAVRPRWLFGRFRTRTTDVEALEREIEAELGDTDWALGGGAAAWRLTGSYRGEETVLHVRSVPEDLPARLRALRSDEGQLLVLSTPMPLAFDGPRPHLVHPLLVYTEMLASQDPRTRGAAEDVRRRFLAELS